MDHTLALIGRAHQGDKEARDTLFAENMGLVYSVTRRFLGRGVEMEDLFQIGSIGLLKAVDKFNPEFDVKFSTYAVPMIVGEIKRFLRDDGILKVSRSIKENQYKIYKVREEMEKKLGREPDMGELSKAMDIPVEELAMTMESAAEVDSIYKTVYQGDGTDLQLVDRLPEKEDSHQKLLDKIEGTPEEAMISRLALRSMKQARYSPDNDGHFGLATQYYTHFTSPIRRYPDLQIHRIIKDNLRGRMNDAKRHHYEKILPEVAMETSSLERRADEAERETLKLKKVQYMRNFFGQEFEGVISGITKWGIYVELPNTVEGLVHVTNMTDDHYDYDEEHYQMIGSHHRKTYKLGQKVRVKMIDCDEISRTIDFRLVKERKEEREDG